MFSLPRTSKRFLPCVVRHVVRYKSKSIFPEPFFFNRDREIESFTNIFSGEPSLSVILGPPSCGKTALIRKVVKDTRVEDAPRFHPVILDGRGGQFHSVENVYFSLSGQFDEFADRAMKKLDKFEIDLTGLRISYSQDKDKDKKIIVSDLFDKISSKLPNWSFWSGRDVPSPILVVDEVNLLGQFGENSADSKWFIKIFLDWMVKNTKQEQRFHVVLTTSDSFFLEWIQGRKFDLCLYADLYLLLSYVQICFWQSYIFNMYIHMSLVICPRMTLKNFLKSMCFLMQVSLLNFIVTAYLFFFNRMVLM